MALASGVLVATAVVDLLPEAHELAGRGAVLEVGIAALVGYLAFLFVEAFLHQTSFEHAQGSGGQAGPATGPPRPMLAVLPPASLIAGRQEVRPQGEDRQVDAREQPSAIVARWPEPEMSRA